MKDIKEQEELEKYIIASGYYDIVFASVQANVEISILMDNHNDWDKPLPEQLQKAEKFKLDIKGQTLEDSFIDENMEIQLQTIFGDQDYFKTLHLEDISGIFYKDQLIAGKPWVDKNEVKEIEEYSIKTFGIPSDEDIENSMKYFRKYNPKMFSIGNPL